MLAQLDTLSEQILQFEGRLKELVEVTPPMQWLMTLPGVGVILAATVALEIGEIERFPSAEHLASYGGTTPRVHASGDRVRYGRTRPDVNRVCRSRQLGGSESHAVPGAPRQPTLPAVAPAQGTREGDRSGGTTFGGSRVPRAQPPGGVSRSDGKTGSDQGGVSAILS
jgi:hypothetical protein